MRFRQGRARALGMGKDARQASWIHSPFALGAAFVYTICGIRRIHLVAMRKVLPSSQPPLAPSTAPFLQVDPEPLTPVYSSLSFHRRNGGGRYVHLRSQGVSIRVLDGRWDMKRGDGWDMGGRRRGMVRDVYGDWDEEMRRFGLGGMKERKDSEEGCKETHPSCLKWKAAMARSKLAQTATSRVVRKALKSKSNIKHMRRSEYETKEVFGVGVVYGEEDGFAEERARETSRRERAEWLMRSESVWSVVDADPDALRARTSGCELRLRLLRLIKGGIRLPTGQPKLKRLWALLRGMGKSTETSEQAERRSKVNVRLGRAARIVGNSGYLEQIAISNPLRFLKRSSRGASTLKLTDGHAASASCSFGVLQAEANMTCPSLAIHLEAAALFLGDICFPKQRIPFPNARPTPMDNSSTKGITIEVKRVTGLPSVTGLKPDYYIILNVNGISKSTKKVGQKDRMVKWDGKLFFDTEITPSSEFSLKLRRTSRMIGKKDQVTVGLKGEDNGAPLQVLLIFGGEDIRTEMNTQVDDAQRSVAASGLGDAPIVETVSSSIDIISKGESSILATINTWEPVWTKFNSLVELAEKISEIHPYAKIASSVLLSAYHVWKAQKDRDSNMFMLLQTIHDFCDFLHDTAPTEIVPSQWKTLQKIMEQIIDCSQFISGYCRDRNFALKAVKHLFSNVDDAIKKYMMSFEKLKIAFTDAAAVFTQLGVINLTASLAALHVDVNLNDMPYAEGARYKSGKGCIQGTRVKVLDAITQWAFKNDLDSPICLLLGPAGAGKSAIAHSVARIFDHLGRLGSSFCFVRGDTSRRLQLYLPTLARDLAHRDPHIKKSLGHVIEDPSLRKTDDLGDQFDHFITQTAQGCSLIGPILIVIDALDECGDGKHRKEFFKLLTNPETMKKLPSNFRIFITSRPDQDVQGLFSKMHILQLQDEQYKENTDKDIFSFVCHELLELSLQGITEAHCKQIVNKSEGLFQWASVACQFVQDAADSGQPPTYALKQILSSGSGLYKLYTTTLNNRFKRIKDTSFNQQFKDVLGFILGVNKPLPKTSLSLLWRLRFGKEISEDMNFILSHLGSLFNGIGDTAVVSPIHTSVRDFFTSPKDSGAFFIKTEDHHFDISLGLIHVLNTQLCFNICHIQTSYTQNSNIKELNETIQKKIAPELSYACQFLGAHLQKLSDAGKQDKEIHTLLKEFLEKKLLFWLEALGLLKKIDCAISCLSEILDLVKEIN
ncbi:hypothetical protein M422DRAFT_242820 [Sphaerobolus stellatus SS14]|nr:hypothetical protein M422DRAFT_242820 [Sphaerobolus stellatus SS14]